LAACRALLVEATVTACASTASSVAVPGCAVVPAPVPAVRQVSAACWPVAVAVAGAAVAASACCAVGAATSAPAMATAGAALPACCATFSTCEGLACRPLRLILTAWRPLRAALMVPPTSVPCPSCAANWSLSADPDATAGTFFPGARSDAVSNDLLAFHGFRP
jgi:hypothetical protein